MDLHYYIYLRGGDSFGGEKAWNSTEGRAGASGKREAHVLKGVTGVLHPSEMAAILGECLTVGGVEIEAGLGWYRGRGVGWGGVGCNGVGQGRVG